MFGFRSGDADLASQREELLAGHIKQSPVGDPQFGNDRQREKRECAEGIGQLATQPVGGLGDLGIVAANKIEGSGR